MCFHLFGGKNINTQTREEIKQETLNLINDGLTREAIMSELGIDNNVYYKIIKELGVKPRRKKYTFTKQRKPRKPRYDYEAIKQYRAEGHTYAEITEVFGCCRDTIRFIINDGKAPGHNQHGTFEEREYRVSKMIEQRLECFEYAGGFKGSENSVKLRCKECGNVIERSLITIRHNKNTVCPCCLEAERKAKRIEEERRKQEAKAEKQRQREIAKLKRIKYKQMRMKTCVVCGSLFVPANLGRRVCSDECGRRLANRRKDKRITKDKMIDKDITLGKLYERDNGICHLCGGLCDWNDEPNHIDSKYPSIDHLIPIANGGEHSWENVKLAHWYCNTLRGDAPLF